MTCRRVRFIACVLAREAALARVASASIAGSGACSPGARSRCLNRRLLVPLFALILGLSGPAFLAAADSSHHTAATIAELDAQVLTDELPVTAYLDTGFEVWLYHHTPD